MLIQSDGFVGLHCKLCICVRLLAQAMPEWRLGCPVFKSASFNELWARGQLPQVPDVHLEIAAGYLFKAFVFAYV